MKIISSFFSKKKRQSLSELDEFYKNTVSLFSKETKIQYIESLIDRCKQDINLTRNNDDKARIQKLLSTAIEELHKFKAKL